MNSSVILGTTIRFYTSAPFATVAGVATDPTEVVFGFQIGSGVVNQVTYGAPVSWGTIVRDSAGTYHIDINTNDTSVGGPGIWTYVWAGTGTVQTRA